jgi:uncharacterized protein (TIGR03435 family)
MLRGILFVFCLAPPAAQIATAPAFEVASVRPTQHGRTLDGWSHSSADIPSPGRFVAENSSLDELIRFAYQVKDYQVSGPIWLNDDAECFDISAKTATETSTAQIRAMVQTTLAERLKLALHCETRELPVYALLPSKRGPKLNPAAGNGRSSTRSAGGNVTATNVSMAEFAYQLSRWLKRPVFDQTQIPGIFDFALQYDERETGERPSLFTALEEQLGLRLAPTKGPVEILVIDHVEKMPTDN